MQRRAHFYYIEILDISAIPAFDLLRLIGRTSTWRSRGLDREVVVLLLVHRPRYIFAFCLSRQRRERALRSVSPSSQKS